MRAIRIINMVKAVSLAATFPAAIGCAPAHFDTSSGAAMSESKPPAIADTKATESFVQGNSGNQLDILIVNDNSMSMDPEQRKLASSFGSFVSSISDIDYHIGMTTTDLESPRFNQGGRLLTWSGTTTTVLTPATLNPSQVFMNSVLRQETLDCDGSILNCPASNEQPLLATIMAISQRSTANVGFFRDAAPLIVVILSDEDEQSTGGPAATSSAAVLNAVTAAFGAQKTLVFFGIVVQQGDTSCLAAQKAQEGGTATSSYGTRATELAAATGGKTISICENDFSSPLADMSRAMRKLVTSYKLKKAPKGGVAKVTFTPASVSIGYKLDGMKLVLDAPPPIGTKIDVTYDQ
jgi:hypothetical protein